MMHDRLRRIVSSRPRRGMVLLELLAVMALLGVAVVVAGRLGHSSMNVIRLSSRDRAQRMTLQRVIDRMRADAWGSYAMALGDEHTLVLHTGAGRLITWHLDAAAGQVERTDAAEQPDETKRQQPEREQWRVDDASLHFSGRSMIELDRTGGPMHPAGRWMLVSQLMIAARGGS